MPYRFLGPITHAYKIIRLFECYVRLNFTKPDMELAGTIHLVLYQLKHELPTQYYAGFSYVPDQLACETN